MDCKAQVSFEYLLTIMFAILLVLGAAVLIMSLESIAQTAQTKILEIRDNTITALMS
jgi:uncharacterized protein (UPF0333 family)